MANQLIDGNKLVYASFEGVYVYLIPEPQAYPAQPVIPAEPPPSLVSIWAFRFPGGGHICNRGLSYPCRVKPEGNRVVICATRGCYEISIPDNALSAEDVSKSELLSTRSWWPSSAVYFMGVNRAIGSWINEIAFVKFSGGITTDVLIPDPLSPDAPRHPLLDEISGRFVLKSGNTASIFDVSTFSTTLSL